MRNFESSMWRDHEYFQLEKSSADNVDFIQTSRSRAFGRGITIRPEAKRCMKCMNYGWCTQPETLLMVISVNVFLDMDWEEKYGKGHQVLNKCCFRENYGSEIGAVSFPFIESAPQPACLKHVTRAPLVRKIVSVMWALPQVIKRGIML